MTLLQMLNSFWRDAFDVAEPHLFPRASVVEWLNEAEEEGAIRKGLLYAQEDIDIAVRDNKERLEKEIEGIRDERKKLLTSFGKENNLLRQVCDLALLSNGMLKGEELDKFVKRSLSLLS